MLVVIKTMNRLSKQSLINLLPILIVAALDAVPSQTHGGRRAHLIHVFEGVDDVVRQAGQQVDNKPGLQVVHANQLGVWDDLTGGSDERGVEV